MSRPAADPAALRGRAAFALGLGLLEFLGGTAVLAYVAAIYGGSPGGLQSVLWGTVFLGFPLVGGLTARLRPRHPVGWLLLAIGALGMGSQFCFTFSPGPHLSVPAALVLGTAGYALTSSMGLMAVLVLVFPDGVPPLGARRRLVWGGLTLVLLLPLASYFTPSLSSDAAYYRNPLSPPGLNPWLTVGGRAGLLLLLALVVIAAVDATVRLRRARGVTRLQLKWLAFAAAVLVPALAVAVGVSTLWSPIPLVVASNGLAASIGLAIVRYHLYDIDRIISRSLSYTAVSGILLGVYVGLVTLATRVLPFSSELGVAGATLAAAALFNPLRRRIQRLVDRRFNRPRYSSQETLERFSRRARGAVDLEAVRRELIDSVAASVQPTRITLWLRAAAAPQRPGGPPE